MAALCNRASHYIFALLKYRTQKVAKKSSSGHHRTTLFRYIFTTKARIDDR